MRTQIIAQADQACSEKEILERQRTRKAYLLAVVNDP